MVFVIHKINCTYVTFWSNRVAFLTSLILAGAEAPCGRQHRRYQVKCDRIPDHCRGRSWPRCSVVCERVQACMSHSLFNINRVRCIWSFLLINISCIWLKIVYFFSSLTKSPCRYWSALTLTPSSMCTLTIGWSSSLLRFLIVSMFKWSLAWNCLISSDVNDA